MPAAGARTDQGYLNRLPEYLLPKTVVGDIFSKAQEQSILMTLGQQIPVGIGETVIRYGGTDPEAGQVGGTTLASREGAEKPLSGLGFGEEKSFAPIKLAVIVTASEEFARENPEGLYSDIAPKLSAAISRAADLAVFHNRSALTGAELVGTANNGFINQTTNRVELNLHPEADPNLVEQILAGYELVVEDEDKNFDFTGFAAVPSYRSKLARARDRQGNLAFQAGSTGNLGLVQGPVNLNNRIGELLGLPVAFGRTVGGKIGAYAGTDVKMVGGDFTQLAYGFADQIRIKVSDQATVGGVSMWQTNQVAILAEATFGWIVNDIDAFVAFDNAVADAAPVTP